MVVDCNYNLDQLYVVEGGPPPGGDGPTEDAILKATTWLIDHCEEENGTLKVNWFNLTVVEFATLGVSCPELAPLRKNLNGFRRLLEVVIKRLNDPTSIASCNAQLVGKFTDAVNAKNVLSYPYHAGLVRRELIPVHKDFVECAKNMLQHALWLEHRIRNSQELLIAYNHFVKAVDPLADSFHSMDSGTMTRE